MQTFLPYPNFKQSAEVLDGARLRKQLLECEGILQAIHEKTGWTNHPATKMWENHPGGLISYAEAIKDEIKRRGFKFQKTWDKIQSYPRYSRPDSLPEWLKNEDIFRSHRSNLLRKGRADAVCERIRKGLKLKSINGWLKGTGRPQKNILTLWDVMELEELASFWQLPPIKNFYTQYGWTEPETLPYIWPS